MANVLSPLPEPDKGGFLNTIRSAADSLLNVPRQVKDFLGGMTAPSKVSWTFNQPSQVQAQAPATPTPTPSPMPLRKTAPLPAKPAKTATPAYTNRQIPAGTDLAMKFISSIVPNGRSLEEAFPALSDPEFMQGIREADALRPGLGNLLLLQSLFESTLGRNTANVFGVKPGGKSQGFSTPSAALQYQLGPSVLGGGANPNMNILNTNAPLTIDDVMKLYESYNPEGAYLQQLLDILSGR